ncbi:hypothetical protein ACFVVX_31500 [Kitasatospora sp. NPDC058170]|uniref:hypothetical protein n=1 Tax=Kitasatospora sp. NPDC058170 TaxID=3346364 RepID=UPI0036D87A33
MPTADISLRDEYAAAVERLAGRTLDTLRGVGGAAALADPGTAAAPRPLLAAARVLGPDLFAPQLLGGAAPDEQTALLLAEAQHAFPSPAVTAPATNAPTAPGAPSPSVDEDGPAGAALIAAWRDWATGVLLTRTLRSVTAQGFTALDLAAPQPEHAPHLRPHAWQGWSVRMAQLSALALPDLDGPVHEAARANTLALARGTVRSMLRRDHRVAARLARWLCWTQAQGLPLPLEVEPVLERIQVVGDGSARTALELAIGAALLATDGNGARP